MLTAHYKSEHIGLFEKSLRFQVWWIILYTIRKPNTDRGLDWLGAIWGFYIIKCESKIDEDHRPFSPVRRAVTAKTHSFPPLEWANEILKWPGEWEDDLLPTAVQTKYSSVEQDALRPTLGRKHSWVPLSSIRENCEEGLGL